MRQYAVVITVNLSMMVTGLGLAWSSPMLVKLSNANETVLDQPITDDQGSWIVSVGPLSAAVANFLPAVLLDRIGRKYCIILGVLPKLVGAFFLLFATEYWMLLLGRTLSGSGDALIFTVVPIYASEISSKEVRGALGTILQVMSSLGILIMLSVGPFVSYLAINILFTTITVICIVPLIFLPDSPYFLFSKGRTDEALKVLTFLRGSDTAANAVLKEYAIENQTETVNKMQLFRQKVFVKALVLVMILVIGAQFIGFNAVSWYLQTILESTQTSIRPEIASVIIGCIQLVASIFTALVTDKFGRKPILIVTLFGMMVGMVGLGTFFNVTENVDIITGFLNFLPLMSLILIVFCFSAGPGSVNWALSAELFDGPARSLGMSISTTLASASAFFLTRYFPALMASIGPAATYWGFSLNCVLLGAFILFVVPETKGKTFSEIQVSLGAKRAVDDEEKAVK